MLIHSMSHNKIPMLRLLQHRRNQWLQRQLRSLSAVAQQKGLAFDVSTFSQFVQDASVHIPNFLPFLLFKPALFRATTLQMVSPGYTHKHGAELGRYKLQVTKHKVDYDASIKQ